MKIETLRKAIDSVDLDILRLLNDRAKVVKEIGEIKRKSNQISYVPHREKQVILNLIKKNKGPLPALAIEAIYREILNNCRSLESKIKVAYLGPEATFTHKAALKNFGAGAEYIPVKSISDVFPEVEKGRVDFGVVPIENSTEGIINHTLDMFIDSDLTICAELNMQIEECLLSSSGRKDKIKVVVSHPQPLAQCRLWLEKNLPGVPVREMSSTTEAAKYALKNHNAAAIASSTAAELYKLEIIAKGIEDSKENFTRFLVVGNNRSQKSGHDKTSILFSIKDKIGALHDILMVFKKHNLNMTKIESRPTKKKAWQYIFFADFLGHISDKNVSSAVAKLEESCSFVKVLGSYPRAD